MNLEKELSLAIKSARRAGDYLRQLPETKVDKDFGKDIKLEADWNSNSLILDELRNSEYPILSEESSDKSFPGFDAGAYWIVDPLDGSLNFSRGMPNAVVSVALWEGFEPLLGVIYDFNRNDLYDSIPSLGISRLNGRGMNVSRVTEKEKAVLCTGFPSHTDYSEKHLLDFVKEVQQFKKVRLLGSAALSLAYVASGKADAYNEQGIMLWDVAAGLALVKSAGGDFTIEKGKGKYQFNVSASNGKIPL